MYYELQMLMEESVVECKNGTCWNWVHNISAAVSLLKQGGKTDNNDVPISAGGTIIVTPGQVYLMNEMHSHTVI